MKCSSRRVGGGDSLIEVLIAVSPTAITALGIIDSQLWLARNEHSLMAHELARRSRISLQREYVTTPIAIRSSRNGARELLRCCRMATSTCWTVATVGLHIAVVK